MDKVASEAWRTDVPAIPPGGDAQPPYVAWEESML